MKTVKEVSKLTGISVRTLHYYDEIGLLKPTVINEAKYRLYDDRALGTLQQILFFKEFDFSLTDIKEIMQNPTFDKKKTMAGQRELLILKRKRLDGLIKLINEIMEGDNTMSFQEFSKDDIEKMFEVLRNNLNEKQLQDMIEKHGSVETWKEDYMKNAGSEEAQQNFKKVMEWYGSKEEAMDVLDHPMSAETLQAYQNRIASIYEKLGKLQVDGVDTFDVKRLVGEYEFVSKQLYQMKDVKNMLVEMAHLYMENKDVLKANDAQYGEGASEFIGKAILNYYHS